MLQYSDINVLFLDLISIILTIRLFLSPFLSLSDLI